MGLFRFRERHPLQRECGPWQRASADTKRAVVSFNGLGVSCANDSGNIAIILGKERRLPGLHAPLVFCQCLGAVLAPLAVSFSLLTEGRSLIGVHSSAI